MHHTKTADLREDLIQAIDDALERGLEVSPETLSRGYGFTLPLLRHFDLGRCRDEACRRRAERLTPRQRTRLAALTAAGPAPRGGRLQLIGLAMAVGLLLLLPALWRGLP